MDRSAWTDDQWEAWLNEPCPPCHCGGPRTWRKNGKKRTSHCQACYRTKNPLPQKDDRSHWTDEQWDRLLSEPCPDCPTCGDHRTWRRHGTKPIRYGFCPSCNRGQSSRWRKGNPEYQKGWTDQNRDKIPGYGARRRARKAQAASDGLHLSLSPNAKCYVCLRAPVEAIDHIIPLARGGSDRLSNKAGACRSCNSAKHASTWPGRPDWDGFVRRRRALHRERT